MRSNKPDRDAKRSSRDKETAGHASPREMIYGLNPVLEVLRAGTRQVEHITIAEGSRQGRLWELLELAKRASVPVHRVPKVSLERAFDLIGGEQSHQGVIARLAAARYFDSDQLIEALAERVGGDDPPLALGLDGIEDPRNLGAILRTAECAGVHGVFIPERRAVGLNETVAKAAAGALEYVSVARVVNLVRLIEQLKERNIWVVGASLDGKVNYAEWDWSLPTVIFLGSEGSGLHRLVKENCDALLRIPALGRIESLNVSVAAGVLLYEARRQRGVAKARSEAASNVTSSRKK